MRTKEKRYQDLLPLLAAVILHSPSYAQSLSDQAEFYNLSAGLVGSFWGNGVCFYDVNDDGFDDITLIRDSELLTVYLSNGSSFTPVVTNIFCQSKSLHALWVDYDNDGDLDLLLTQFQGVNRLYQNDGNFNFTDVTVVAGLPLETAQNYGASFGDYDKDGFLDLYMCRYYAPDDVGGKTNLLFRNNGNGTFTDMTDSLGVGDAFKPSFMAVWMDMNNNGWPDLFVINDRFPGNTMFRNNGDGSFTDITSSSNLSLPHNDIMCLTPADFDNDGDLDIFMTNGGNVSNMPVILMVNHGNEEFSDMGGAMGLSSWEITWGSVWFDLDNDGWRDLFYCSSEMVNNSLYLNQGGLTFENISDEMTSPVKFSYTCATGDFNNDGFADIIVHNLPPQQPIFLVNSGGTSHYIKIRLNGTISNRDAIGAWIHVYRGAESYHHFTLCGEGFTSQNSQNIIFGLGNDPSTPDSVVVTYPSGHSDKYCNPSIDMLHSLTEGETYVNQITASNSGFCAGDSIILDAGIHSAYQWSTGDTTQTIWVQNGGIYSVSVSNEYGINAGSSIEIEMHANPLISATLQHPLCFASSSGSIGLENENNTATATVFWNNGLNGLFLDSLASGVYNFLFTDVNGCSAHGSIQLIDPPQLVVIIFIQNEQQGGDGGIYFSIFGGTPPYTISINGNEATVFNENLIGGTYYTEVQDGNGCSFEYIAVVESLLNTMSEIKGQKNILYPNPTTGPVNIVHESGIRLVEVFDLEGRLIMELNGLSGPLFNLSHLPNATYMMRIHDSAGKVFHEKLVKL